MRYDFDMVVIGGGAAGLTAAGLAASLGAKTALVEARKLGGDCTWYGCVPSKTLLKAAKIADHIRTADRYGLLASKPSFDFAKVMDHVHAVQESVYREADAPPIYEKLGVKVVIARASFLDRHRIELIGEQGARRELSSRFFAIATGSAPLIPPIEGISTVKYLTNETVFSISDLPTKLIVVGAGPIGIEMAQALRRFGSEVVVIDVERRILPREDPELAELLKQTLGFEGIQFILGSPVKRVGGSGQAVRVAVESGSPPSTATLEGDAILLAAGRRAQVDGLNLHSIGVQTTKAGILVDQHCRTSVANIFACGDVTGLYHFTHMSEHMAKVAVTNAILHLPVSLDTKNVPWCTYTDPELAHVGASEDDLKKREIGYDVYRFPFTKIDRAITDSETTGMIKVLAKRWKGTIYGASILGTNAGDMISEYALAMRNKLSLRRIADTIHPYPTYALGNRRAADQWYVRKQSRTLVRWLQLIFGYRGQLPDTSDPNRIL